MKIKDIGEQGLLKIIQSFCPQNIIGDDAAVLTLTQDHQLVVTSDVLVNGVHFSDRTTSPLDVGWRAVAANLSDLAAMGASPVGITVGLALPPETPVDWVENLYLGMTQCLKSYPILGGDLVRSDVITVSITALGEVLPNRVIRRDAAKVGDVILITGYHGLSRGGLELLLNQNLGRDLDTKTKEKLIKTHQRPQPRLDVLPLLWELGAVSPPGGMDSSDGLADAIIQICRASGVGAIVNYNSIPVCPSLIHLGGREKALDWVLYGGEDFELVLSLPEDLARMLLKRLDVGAAIIGNIITGNEVKLVDTHGIYSDRILTLSLGFAHFG